MHFGLGSNWAAMSSSNINASRRPSTTLVLRWCLRSKVVFCTSHEISSFVSLLFSLGAYSLVLHAVDVTALQIQPVQLLLVQLLLSLQEQMG